MKPFKNLFASKNVIELKERVDKLERIMKYAKDDGPSFYIKPKMTREEQMEYVYKTGFHSYVTNYANILYLYINGEEYSIDIDGLVDHTTVIKHRSKIELKQNLVYLELWLLKSNYNERLTIDYKTGDYVRELVTKDYKHDGYEAKYVVVDESGVDKHREDILDKLGFDSFQVSQIDPDSVRWSRAPIGCYTISFKLKNSEENIENEP